MDRSYRSQRGRGSSYNDRSFQDRFSPRVQSSSFSRLRNGPRYSSFAQRERGERGFYKREDTSTSFPSRMNNSSTHAQRDQETEIFQQRRISEPRVSKMGRIIIRNLPFSTKEADLHKLMAKCGKITEVKIPRKEDGDMRGFGFVQFQSMNSAETAIKLFNATKLKERPIAVDWAVAKCRYEEAKAARQKLLETSSTKVFEDSKSPDDGLESPDDSEVSFVKPDESELDESSDNNSEDDAKLEEDNEECETTVNKKKPRTPKRPSDVDQGKTVFIRNIPFTASDESLKQTFATFGIVKYARICFDKDSGHSRGSGFVQFLMKEDADTVLRLSETSDGIKVDDRKVVICLAESPKQRRKTERGQTEQPKRDNRNLYLLKESQVHKDDETVSPMSQNDERKRAALDKKRIESLKNLHMFVSPTRLSVHNLPKSVDNNMLKKLFQDAAGVSKYKIKECRVMQDKKTIDNNDKAKSLGFGFVEFDRHEDALNALKELNNNPDIFFHDRRPIVEFALENKAALLKKKARLEHSQAKLKMLRSQPDPQVSNEKPVQKKDIAKPLTNDFSSDQEPVKKDSINSQLRKCGVTLPKERLKNSQEIQQLKKSSAKKITQKTAVVLEKSVKRTNKKRKLVETEGEDDFASMVKKYKCRIQSHANDEVKTKTRTRWFDE